MSIYVIRYIEIKYKNTQKWKQLTWTPHAISSCYRNNALGLRNYLRFNFNNRGLPKDVSSNVKQFIEEVSYKYNVGYVTLDELYKLYDEEMEKFEKNMLNVINSSFIHLIDNKVNLILKLIMPDNSIFEKDIKKLPYNQDINVIDDNIKQEYIDDIYDIISLKCEAEKILFFAENIIDTTIDENEIDDIRIVYYFQ